MLYLIAHSFLNGQSKKFKFFSVTRTTRDAIKKKNVELWGREWDQVVFRPADPFSSAYADPQNSNEHSKNPPTCAAI